MHDLPALTSRLREAIAAWSKSERDYGIHVVSAAEALCNFLNRKNGDADRPADSFAGYHTTQPPPVADPSAGAHLRALTWAYCETHGAYEARCCPLCTPATLSAGQLRHLLDVVSRCQNFYDFERLLKCELHVAARIDGGGR